MILLVIPIIMGLFLFILVIFALLIIIDVWAPLKAGSARVIGLENDKHRPDYMDFIARLLSGYRVSRSQMIIQVEGEISRAYVSLDLHDRAKMEQEVKVNYRLGRITKYPYIEKVSL